MRFIEPELVEIPHGSVLLGVPCPPSDFALQHCWNGPRRVELKAFKIARACVTRAEYALFIGAIGHPLPADWDDPALSDPRQPVGGVSAEDADAYCRWLSEVSGRSYRLPFVDEWEKAARGGLEGKMYSWGDEAPVGRCCYGLGSEGVPRPVGSYPPNGFGLHEMTGNIWQWMADLYIDIAEDAPVNTPTGKPPEINRVLVGGSFATSSVHCLWSAYRHDDPPDLRHRCLGFRLVADS